MVFQHFMYRYFEECEEHKASLDMLYHFSLQLESYLKCDAVYTNKTKFYGVFVYTSHISPPPLGRGRNSAEVKAKENKF